MNNKFDELAKSLAQSVTRRGALKKFGVGLAGIALATLGLANKAQAGFGPKGPGNCLEDCVKGCEQAGYPRQLCHDSCKSLCTIRCC